MEDATRRFNAIDNKTEMKEILTSVYHSLVVKGYNPINQLVGYILSEDPTYITNYNNARSLICRLDRDELLQELLTSYLDKRSKHCYETKKALPVGRALLHIRAGCCRGVAENGQQKQKNRSRQGRERFALAAEEGFEPSQTESESGVLPLHNSATNK